MSNQFQQIKLGMITENLSNGRFEIETIDGEVVQAYLSGKMRFHHIRVGVGDKVQFVVDSQGNNNRIIKRL